MRTGKRIGNDFCIFDGDECVFTIKNYYIGKPKQKKKKLSKSCKKVIKWSFSLIAITLAAFIIYTPLFQNLVKSPSKVDFQVESEEESSLNTFRAGYAITFPWHILISPARVLVIWGDGNTEDLTNQVSEERSGYFNHTYKLQGKYSPILLVWDSLGVLFSKSQDVNIQNNVLSFNIECSDMDFRVSEDQDVAISIENIRGTNGELLESKEELNFIYDLSETQIISNESTLNYNWKNAGVLPFIVTIMDEQGTLSRNIQQITVINKPPSALFTMLGDGPYNARTPIEFSAENSQDTVSDKKVLRYLWKWGDNTGSWGKYASHSYYEAGIYEITLIVIDDDGASDTFSNVITVSEPVSSELPIYNSTGKVSHVAIGTFLDEVFEDEEVQFTSEVHKNITDFSALWNFGDGTLSNERAPSHAWIDTGNYTVILNITDSEGNSYMRSRPITILEKAPEIQGPCTFQGIEGQALTLDVEVHDSLMDEPSLEFKWFNEKDELISTEKKPTFTFNEGNHVYTLRVSDKDGMTSSHEINAIIHPIAHEIYVQNYMYHGKPGPLQVRAYVYDTKYNSPEYEFKWTIKNGNAMYQTSQGKCTDFHQISFDCTETTVYQGQVKVVDSNGIEKISTFEIFSYIDSTLDGISDEYERMLSPMTAQSDEDTDGDYLPNVYEQAILNTDEFDPDTDNDGLLDGYDDSGIGELTLGTDPFNPDSDGDSLSDGMEYFGWDVTINYFENRSTFHVNSDALLNDTDNDGISDHEEYQVGSHPRLADSDSDGLPDGDDPYPNTWDQDNDFLSDFMEVRLGTDLNMTDTDADGLKDGEEVFGWGVLGYQTDPTSSDTDKDFADDLAEIMNYNQDLEDEYGKDIRVNLTNPVSLRFPEFFNKASIAQISFAITFGEYGEDLTRSYGILDQAVQNLNILITKPVDNVVIYNSTTNSTRYFSHVVDITETMNNDSLNYYGDYVIEVKDVNDERKAPQCLLEQFEIQVSRCLDPHNEDFDGDGIMDGVEMGLLIEGIDLIDIHDYYNSTVADETEEAEYNEFILEIPSTGRVTDAQMVVEIASDAFLIGSGNISVQIFKQSVNNSIEDIIILDYFNLFDGNDQFNYFASFNLSHHVGLDYYGCYLLKIDIQDTSSNDTFHVKQYCIKTETFVQAGPNDSQAWYTDPALEDSDSDGWSDYHEIFMSGSNPLNKDTDGDSAWDSNDRDPLQNVMIEICPIHASWENQAFPWETPSLEIAIKFQVNDLIDQDFSDDTSTIGFYTTPQKATEDPTWWGAYQTARWDEGEGHSYFYDISDDVTIQSNSIHFYLQLWQVNLPTGDVDIFGGSWVYDHVYLVEEKYAAPLWANKVGLYGGTDSIFGFVKVIGIERANTIAVFDANETAFNGHYQEQERMNIIQLHVTEDGHYPGSVSFENDRTGDFPRDCNDVSDPGQSPIVIDNSDGHSKVLQFHDTSTSYRGVATLPWVDSHATGFVEAWLRMSSTTEEGHFSICDGSNSHAIRFRFDNTGYMQYKVGDTYFNIKTYSPNRWYHIRFEWNCYDDWHLWVDGVSQDGGIGYDFKGSPTAMDMISIQTRDVLANYYYYVDAIGGIFDEYYEKGDNLERSDSSGTPFVPGPNIIVIPTSIFTETVLNSYIQNERLDETPLYTSESGMFEFYSIDREGNRVEEQCGDTDFVFLRYGISPTEAMEILDLILRCAVNQSLDENNNTVTEIAVAYDYVSSKLNNTNAVLLNLPQGLLSFIPWIAERENSPFGNAPKPLDFLTLIFMILMIVIPIFGLIVLIGSAVFSDIAKSIGMMVLTFLAKLFWVVIRAALLIFFYIMLAIEILTSNLLIMPIGLALTELGGLLGISCIWGLNWMVSYGKDTRVGHIQINMDQMTVQMEYWINWIYWEFFDLYIPLPDIDFEMNSTLNDPSLTPEPPSLHCGYKQIGGTDSTKFDFYTTYYDGNGEPPEFVKLYLIAPDGSQNAYIMANTDEYEEEYLHLTGIDYNITIDFTNKLTGQWFYYFEAREDSIVKSELKWPNDYYCEPGPFISSRKRPEDYYRYFLFADVENYYGYMNQEFNFMVMGADFLRNEIPNNVFLNILMPDGLINSFLTNNTSSFTTVIGEGLTLRNVTFKTYELSLEFSNFSDFAHPLAIQSYYTAEFPDGNTSLLFDSYEDKFYNDELNLTAKRWFDKPKILPLMSEGKPSIVGWRVEEVSKRILADSTFNSQMPIGPIVDEQFLRFWVFISDPDGNHSYHLENHGFVLTPKLILKNYDSSNSIDPIDMVWAGQNYDPFPNCDAYFVDVIPLGLYTYNYENYTSCDFGPGAWSFNYSITDHNGNTANQRATINGKAKKIWLIGSANQMWSTAFNGYDISGDYLDQIIPGAGLVTSIGVTIGFISTALLSMGGPTSQKIARFTSIGIAAYDIINSIIGLGLLLCSDDTGSLLGMGLGAMISTAGATFAHSIGSLTNIGNLRILNIKNLSILAKVSQYAFLINIITLIICNPTILIKSKFYGFLLVPGSGNEFDWDLPGEDIIRKIPLILNFLISTISLGAILNLAEIKCRVGFSFGNQKYVMSPIMKVVKIYATLKVIIAALCLISFIIKTGMFHVIGNYLMNSLENIFII